MGTTLENVAGAAKMLGSKGAKLHTHEMHISRTDNGGYIAKHDLRDKRGHPPTDGQRSEAIHGLSNHAKLLAHVQQHMAPEPPEPPEEQGEPPQTEGAEGE